MERKFSTIVVGSGHEAAQTVQRVTRENASCGWAAPSNQKTISLENLTALFTHRVASDLLAVPSTVVKSEGDVSFQNSKTLKVGTDVWHAPRIILAPGSSSAWPALQGLKDSEALTPMDLFERTTLPKSAILLGGDPLACGLAFFLKEAGRSVTVVAKERLLSEEEPEISAAVAERLADLGVTLEMNAGPLQVRRENESVCLVFEREGRRQEIKSEEIILAAGLHPNSDAMGLQNAGVLIDAAGQIVVNDEMRTSAFGIWAVGSVTGSTALNQIEEQIRIAVTNLKAPFYARLRMNPDPAPYQLPLRPPLGRAGWREREAKKRWSDARAAVLPLPGGFAKIIARKRSGRLLGASLFCEGAAELSLYFNLGFQLEMSLFDLAEPLHDLPMTGAATAQKLIRTWLSS